MCCGGEKLISCVNIVSCIVWLLDTTVVSSNLFALCSLHSSIMTPTVNTKYFPAFSNTHHTWHRHTSQTTPFMGCTKSGIITQHSDITVFLPPGRSIWLLHLSLCTKHDLYSCSPGYWAKYHVRQCRKIVMGLDLLSEDLEPSQYTALFISQWLLVKYSDFFVQVEEPQT